jgi:uncharacterized protein (TIGR01777 family)
MSRHPEAQAPMDGVAFVPWDGAWQQRLAEVDAVINLAGESIAAKRWSAAQKRRIRDSRVETTKHLVDAMAASSRRPTVLINASAIGYYGDRVDERLLETSPPGTGFLADVCQSWEAEAKRAEALGLRVVRLRIGMVLAAGGGALAKMLPPFLLGLGGPLGHGRQWLSWVHRDDVCGLIQWALTSAQISGAVNATAPEPVTMRELARTLGRLLHRPSWAPVPAGVLRIMLGEMADLLLASQRVIPQVALSGGYTFRYPAISEALTACLR